MIEHIQYIQEAIALSKESVEQGGFPAGSVVVRNGEIVGRGVSNGKTLCDATSHAEIDAIRETSKNLGVRNLNNCVLYSSDEPCVMCLMASSWAYISKIYYACGRNKLSKEYFEGVHNNKSLLENMNRSMGYFHLKEFEETALQIICEWEESLKK